MHILSPKVAALLSSEGWTPGRSIDILPSIQLLKRRGIPVSGAAEEFLREFEGLTIQTPGGLFRLGTQDCASHLMDGDIPYFARINGESLCPVGHGLFAWLLISPSGEFILLDNHWRRYLPCRDLNDAFELLFVPETPKRLCIELGAEHWPPGYQPVDE